MRKNKAFVVLSTHVDTTIRESNPDVHFEIFHSIGVLESHIANLPIRADKMFITAEIMKPTMNYALTTLEKIFNNPFFQVDEIDYITNDINNTSPIRYINERLHTPIRVNQGVLSRDFIYSFINGSLASDDISENRMVRIRMSRKDYLEMTVNESNKDLLEDKYTSDDESLVGLPPIEIDHVNIAPITSVTKLINICGFNNRTRRIFSFLFAQYLSLKGKVIFVESDYDYLEMTDLVSRAGVSVYSLNLEDLLSDAENTLSNIKATSHKLIYIGTRNREFRSYQFLINLLYVNLNGYVNFILNEKNLHELSHEEKHLIVFDNTIVDLLKTLNTMNVDIKESTYFVSLDTLSLPELTGFNQAILQYIIKDIVQKDFDINLLIFKVNSLKFGGEVHDLQSLVEGWVA